MLCYKTVASTETAPATLDAASPNPKFIGQLAVIHGLVSATDYNGICAPIAGIIKNGTRYMVNIPDASQDSGFKTLKVRPQNLWIKAGLDSQDAEGAASEQLLRSLNAATSAGVRVVGGQEIHMPGVADAIALFDTLDSIGSTDRRPSPEELAHLENALQHPRSEHPLLRCMLRREGARFFDDGIAIKTMASSQKLRHIHTNHSIVPITAWQAFPVLTKPYRELLLHVQNMVSKLAPGDCFLWTGTQRSDYFVIRYLVSLFPELELAEPLTVPIADTQIFETPNNEHYLCVRKRDVAIESEDLDPSKLMAILSSNVTIALEALRLRNLFISITQELELSLSVPVLSIGCGTGEDLKALYNAGVPPHLLTGIDSNAGKIEIAKKYFGLNGLSEVRMIPADARSYTPPTPAQIICWQGPELTGFPFKHPLLSVDRAYTIGDETVWCSREDIQSIRDILRHSIEILAEDGVMIISFHTQYERLLVEDLIKEAPIQAQVSIVINRALLLSPSDRLYQKTMCKNQHVIVLKKNPRLGSRRT